jgi:hypothetical protein
MWCSFSTEPVKGFLSHRRRAADARHAGSDPDDLCDGAGATARGRHEGARPSGLQSAVSRHSGVDWIPDERTGVVRFVRAVGDGDPVTDDPRPFGARGVDAGTHRDVVGSRSRFVRRVVSVGSLWGHDARPSGGGRVVLTTVFVDP